jgi:hypothetical protein
MVSILVGAMTLVGSACSTSPSPSPSPPLVEALCEAVGFAARTPSDLRLMVDAARARDIETTMDRAAATRDNSDDIYASGEALTDESDPARKRLGAALVVLATLSNEAATLFEDADGDLTPHEIDDIVRIYDLDPIVRDLRTKADAVGYGSCFDAGQARHPGRVGASPGYLEGRDEF